ncbi:MAG: hypothetical protein GXO47_12355 [Chlorobi bacterium]|nr:hypothetical protein [Chlorobiota bacterium]
MLLKKAHSNEITAYLFVPLFLAGFWIISLREVYIPDEYAGTVSMPLWGMVLKVIKGNKFVASALVMVLALLSAMGINRFVNHYKLLSKPSILPGIIYIILVSGFTEVQQIQPVWFFVPLLMLSIEKLFNAHSLHRPMAYCFDASFWFSVGTLFFGKGLYLYVFILIAMYILRVFNTKSVIASVIGLILPYILVFGYYLMIDKTDVLWNILFENLVSPVAFFSHSAYSRVYLMTMVFIVMLSLIIVARQMPTFKILTRKHYRVFNWLVVLSIMAVMTPFFSIEMIPVISVGAAIVIAHFIDTLRRNIFKELLFAVLIIITVLAQIYM